LLDRLARGWSDGAHAPRKSRQVALAQIHSRSMKNLTPLALVKISQS